MTQPYPPQPPFGEEPQPQPAQQQPQQPAQQPAPQFQQHYSWHRPPPMRVQTEPLEFHRLMRGITRYSWYKPLLVALLAGGIYFGLSIVLGILVSVGYLVVNPSALDSFETVLNDLLVLDTQNPFAIFVGLVSVILMIPSWWLACLALGVRPFGRGLSVALKMRWNLLGWSALAAVASMVALVAVSIGVGALGGGLADDPVAGDVLLPENIDAQKALISMILVLFLVPFQAAAEEYVFRGGLMQVIGSWVKNPWVPILVTSFLFSIAHIYDIWGMITVGLMGLAAGYLTWRTGGLEAAIAIHVLNNYLAFGVLASGVTGETSQTVEGAGPADLIGTTVSLGLFVLFTELIFRHGQRQGKWQRTRQDTVEVYPPVPPQGDAPQMAQPASAAQPDPQGTQPPTEPRRGDDPQQPTL